MPFSEDFLHKNVLNGGSNGTVSAELKMEHYK